MADTSENQSEYPQNAASKPGLGFPLTRAVALISLATGSVVDLAFGKYKGKGTGELGLLRQIVGSLSAGNVLVADRYYPNYSTVAMLLERGVDLVSISHHARTVDFTQGEVLGPKDHIVEWELPQWRGYLDAETYNALPPTVKVREFATEIEDRDGGKLEATFVTTITDRSIPQKEHSDLYWKRWNCEVDIRSIKHALHLDFIRCKTPSMVRKEIWCHALAWNLLRGLMVETAKRHKVLPRQLSLKGTMQAVESFTPAMMAIDGNEALYDAMLKTVSAHRVANRPGRLEPRFKKSRPVWTAQMTIPRSKSRRRLASEARSLT